MSWDFLAPQRLWLLLVVAALVIAYIAAQRRRAINTVRFTQIEMLEQIAPHRPGWRRHTVAGVQLAALTIGVLAAAQPVFGLFGLIDIKSKTIPLDYASLFIAQRLAASMVPTKLPVRATETMHGLVRSSGLNCVIESLGSFWKVVRVQESLPTTLLEILKPHAAIVQNALIDMGQLAVGRR